MKKIKKLVLKFDTVLIILIIVGFVAWLSVNKINETINLYLSIFVIPVLMSLLQNAIVKKQENNSYNIDVYLKNAVKDEIIWKSKIDNSINNIVYINIKNTGKIDIYCLHIKVSKYDGTVSWFEVDCMLNIGQVCIIQMPCHRETIKEIVVTSTMQTESRTNKFNGIQSSNNGIYIFSNMERFSQEKYAVFHEMGFEVFEKLERFWS
ncbi:MAG: hypothetical protein J1E64_15450 [Acetatifactor sp.]|nr:hypothetical protein [Acetatifactor sp.]